MSIKILMREGEWLEVQGILAHHSPQISFGVRFVNLNEGQNYRHRSLIHKGSPIWEDQPQESFRLKWIEVSVLQVM